MEVMELLMEVCEGVAWIREDIFCEEVVGGEVEEEEGEEKV